MRKKPYLHELNHLRPQNTLYAEWLRYAMGLSRDDILDIVHNGLTYQAEALRSMIKEIIAGGAAPPHLFQKLDQIVLRTKQYAESKR